MGGVWLASDVAAVVVAVDEEELVPLPLVMPLEWAGQGWRGGSKQMSQSVTKYLHQTTHVLTEQSLISS